MDDVIRPPRLQPGDEVRVIAPSRSLAIIVPETRVIAADRFADRDLVLKFGRSVEECDDFVSSSIQSRIADLHEAFASKRELKRIPIVANVDFGHTDPILTLPVGGSASVDATTGEPRLEISP